MPLTPLELEVIRSKPVISLTPAEIDMFDDRERGWVLAQLARWDEQDKAARKD